METAHTMADDPTNKIIVSNLPSNPLDAPKRVRTYATDMSDEIRKKGSTLSSIVAAEQETAFQNPDPSILIQPEPAKYTRLTIVATVALFLLGAGILYAAFGYSSSPTTPEQNKVVESIILPNKTFTIAYTKDKSLASLLGAKRFDNNLEVGEIGRIDVTTTGTSSTADLLKLLNAPSTLIREATSVTFGMHAFNRMQPFIIIEISQYDRAYASMLGWEEDMGRALGSFFRPVNGGVAPTTLFTDMVYRNVDLRSSQAEWPIIYAFPRKDVLVITTNTQTLQEIIARIASARVRTVK